MNKLIPISLGIVGVGGIGVGSYLFLGFERNKKVTTTFKEKYQKSLLGLEEGEDSEIWESKFTLLKTGKPNHPDLQNAVKGNDSTAKFLHKKGCKDIYNSPSDNENYLKDFKNYCAKLIGDVVSGTWIESRDHQSGSKWDSHLRGIMGKNNLLSPELKDLSNKITSTSSTFTENERKALEEWCHSRRKDLFAGENDNWIEEIRSYCTG